jgi:hypothetical protein
MDLAGGLIFGAIAIISTVFMIIVCKLCKCIENIYLNNYTPI